MKPVLRPFRTPSRPTSPKIGQPMKIHWMKKYVNVNCCNVVYSVECRLRVLEFYLFNSQRAVPTTRRCARSLYPRANARIRSETRIESTDDVHTMRGSEHVSICAEFFTQHSTTLRNTPQKHGLAAVLRAAAECC